jgi:hypothetical protein
MCGSGLIDLAAEMLNCGIIASIGRLVPSEEIDSGIPDPIKKRVYQNCDGQMEFLVFQESTSRETCGQSDFSRRGYKCLSS